MHEHTGSIHKETAVRKIQLSVFVNYSQKIQSIINVLQTKSLLRPNEIANFIVKSYVAQLTDTRMCNKLLQTKHSPKQFKLPELGKGVKKRSETDANNI